MFSLFKKKTRLPAINFSWAWDRQEQLRQTHGRREVMAAMAGAAYLHGYDIEIVHRTCTHRGSGAHAEDFFIDEAYGLKADRHYINQQLRLCIEEISPGFLEADLLFKERRIRFSKLGYHNFHASSYSVAQMDLLMQPEWDAITISGATRAPMSNPEDIAQQPKRRL